MDDPYPDGPALPIIAFEYETPLWLTRSIRAVETRNGEDADYIVGRRYSIRYRRAGEDWRHITVPAGLVTDLASVPRFARAVIDRTGPHLEASIVHDYLYVAWQDCPGHGARAIDKAFADSLFLAGMTAARVPWLKRTVIYWAVRLFGGGIYRSPNPVRFTAMP